MKTKTKKLLNCAVGLLLLLNFSAIYAIAAAPKDAEAPLFTGPCYQTMGYCNGVLTYKCQKSYTSERCRMYYCAPTCDSGTTPPPTPPSE